MKLCTGKKITWNKCVAGGSEAAGLLATLWLHLVALFR